MLLKVVLSFIVSFASVVTIVTQERCVTTLRDYALVACVTDTLNLLSNGLDYAWASCNVSFAQWLYFVGFAPIIYM